MPVARGGPSLSCFMTQIFSAINLYPINSFLSSTKGRSSYSHDAWSKDLNYSAIL